MRRRAAASLALVLLAAAGCGADESGGEDLASIGVPVGDAGCGEVDRQRFENPLGGPHVENGTELDYPDAPPAAGRHWAVPLQRSEYRTFFTADDRPAKEQLVHSLEHGFTILWYDEVIAADDDAVEDLRAIADGFEVTDGLLIAPWTSADGGEFPGGAHLAFTHWTGPADQHGVHQYCEKVSGETVASFTEAYTPANAPEPNFL